MISRLIESFLFFFFLLLEYNLLQNFKNAIYCKILIIDCNNYVNIYSKYSYNTRVLFFFLSYKLLSLSISKYSNNNNSNVILAFFSFDLVIYCDVLINSDIILYKIIIIIIIISPLTLCRFT